MMARQENASTSQSVREKAIGAYDDAREKASQMRQRGGDAVGGSPFLALGGGLAVGALLAAILPRTRAEERLLGEVGGRLTSGARGAFDAARDAGREKLEELNITADAGKNAVQTLIDGIGEAARTSGKAALEAARNNG